MSGRAKSEPEPPLLSTPQLRERGWTTGLIAGFLGEPDALRPNPRYRSAAPMRLYAQPRVEMIERDPAFVAAKERAALRSQRAKATAARKAEDLLALARSLPITVVRLPPDRLLRRAIAAYNQWHSTLGLERGYDHDPASAASDASFLARITVNFVRHRLTSYDRQLSGAAGKIGVRSAAAVIRSRVYAAIAEAYPHLESECRRQLEEREASVPPATIDSSS